MAAHIETGTMATPHPYSSKLLNHLGLVAGMCDELGLGDLVDRLIVQDGEKRTVSVGQAVKAMILNGLGFANRALYLTPQFFQDIMNCRKINSLKSRQKPKVHEPCFHMRM